MTFPTISGSNLQRQKLVLPQDFHGNINLVFVPFEQWQQMEVDSWSPLAKELEDQFQDLYYYELPTIQSRIPYIRLSSMKVCALVSLTRRHESARLLLFRQETIPERAANAG